MNGAKKDDIDGVCELGGGHKKLLLLKRVRPGETGHLFTNYQSELKKKAQRSFSLLG